MKSLILIFSSLLLGCASIVSDSSYPVTINSTPSGSQFKITNKKGFQVHSGQTPAIISLDSGSGYFSSANYALEITKEGYYPQQQQITTSLDSWYWGNILLGGLIGFLIVDPITGAMYEIDQQQVNITLNEDK